MLAILASLLMLAPNVAVAIPAADDGSAPRVIVLKGGTGYAAADADVVTTDDGKCTVKVKTLAEPAEWPKVWIGVRLTPIPAPLAAHLGARGVMVGNVVKGSPADQAGLQQYDIIVSVDGQELINPPDLSAAIGKATPGTPARLGVIRKAQSQEVQITPAERAADAPIELKFDEPEDTSCVTTMGLRALQRDADGNWTMRDFGPMQGLPDMLKELQGKFNIHMNPDDADVRKFFWRGSPDDELLKGFGGDDAEDGQVELQIRVDKDGAKTSIHRDTNGQITVTKTDAQGAESTATYENADALREADPETFELYSRHADNSEIHMFNMGPLGSHKFKVQIRKRVEDALKHAQEASQEALEKARTAQEEALQKAQEAFKHYEMKMQSQSGAPDGKTKAATQLLMVTRGDDGAVKITQTINGATTHYSYKNVDELKTQNPDLYEQVKDCLAGGPSDDED